MQMLLAVTALAEAEVTLHNTSAALHNTSTPVDDATGGDGTGGIRSPSQHCITPQ
jgi:hypothetical protein